MEQNDMTYPFGDSEETIRHFPRFTLAFILP